MRELTPAFFNRRNVLFPLLGRHFVKPDIEGIRPFWVSLEPNAGLASLDPSSCFRQTNYTFNVGQSFNVSSSPSKPLGFQNMFFLSASLSLPSLQGRFYRVARQHNWRMSETSSPR